MTVGKLVLFLLGALLLFLGAFTFSGNELMWVCFALGAIFILVSLTGKRSGNRR